MIKTIILDLGNVMLYVDEKKRAELFGKYTKYNPDFILDVFSTSKIRKSFEKGKISSEEFFNHFKNRLKLNLNETEF